MALREMMTLVEMRSEVLKRCALPVELSVDIHDQIDSFLRQAQKTYWNKFPALRTRTRRDITLTQSVTTYDLPDDFDAGSIYQVSAATNLGREWTLEPGIRPEDRSDAALSSSSAGDEPSRYEFVDGQLLVLRAPSADVTTLRILGHSAISLLTEEDDRPATDDEAMIQFSVIELKKFKKMLTPSEARQEHADLEMGYVADVDGNQGQTDTFLMGGQYDDPNERPIFRRDRPWWLANQRP